MPTKSLARKYNTSFNPATQVKTYQIVNFKTNVIEQFNGEMNNKDIVDPGVILNQVFATVISGPTFHFDASSVLEPGSSGLVSAKLEYGGLESITMFSYTHSGGICELQSLGGAGTAQKLSSLGSIISAINCSEFLFTVSALLLK